MITLKSSIRLLLVLTVLLILPVSAHSGLWDGKWNTSNTGSGASYDDTALVNSLAGKASLTSPVAGSDNVTRDKRLLVIADTATKEDKLYTIKIPKTKAYTFVLTDANCLIMADNASAQTYTIPGTTAVSFSVGTQIDVVQSGAGKLTFAGAGGVAIRSIANKKSVATQDVGVTLIKTDNSTWFLIGSLIE